MDRPLVTPERFEEMHFPVSGLDVVTHGFEAQMPREALPGLWARTTPSGVNVRGFDALSQRARGGSRPGLVKYVNQAVVPNWIVQELALLVSDKGTAVQLSQSGRVVTLVAVSQGNVFALRAGDTAWTQAINNSGATPPLNFSGIVYSTALNQLLWFVDGVNKRFYDSGSNTINTWNVTAGSFPTDSGGNLPRLICTWRGRIVLSGLLLDPQNWFMSAIGDVTNGGMGALDFNYFRVNFSPTQAVAGTNSPMGVVGDVVTSLCPYSDDKLIFFGDHTIYMLKGDPLQNGQLDLVSDAIGGAWGICWCKDPYGNVYFLSNKCGIYSMVPDYGQQPQRISQPIEQLLLSIDTGANGFRLVWDDRYQGLHVFVTPLAAAGSSTHFFYEQRTGAWWTDTFANPNHSPLAACVFDGNTPGDRLALIGSWDGFVRNFSPSGATDDGYAISSSVVIGPLVTKEFDEILLKDIQGLLGQTSGSVSYQVYVGHTAEQALGSSPVASGTWTNGNGGRNPTSFVRRSGHAVYVKLTSTNQWAMENIRARIALQGKVRRRGA